MSAVTAIASATIDWMADDHSREDNADEVWAFALATVVDGVAITPMGFDVSDQLTDEVTDDYCNECSRRLTNEPDGSTLCRTCFIHGPADDTEADSQ